MWEVENTTKCRLAWISMRVMWDEELIAPPHTASFSCGHISKEMLKGLQFLDCLQFPFSLKIHRSRVDETVEYCTSFNRRLNKKSDPNPHCPNCLLQSQG